MTFTELELQLGILQQDYPLTEAEKSACQVLIEYLQRKELEYQASRRKQAQREVERLLCSDKVTLQELVRAAEECSVKVILTPFTGGQRQAIAPRIQSTRWWEVWK